MKVLNLSPQRNGTQSFHSYMCAHGLRSLHWCGPEVEAQAQATMATLPAGDLPEQLWEAFAPYYALADFYADFPTPLIYRAALHADPQSRFVFVQRDPHDWVRSVRGHIGGKPLSFCEYIFYSGLTGARRGSVDDYSDAELVAGYFGMCARLVTDFRGQSHRLLWLQLGADNVGPRIAEFCGFEQRYPYPQQR